MITVADCRGASRGGLNPWTLLEHLPDRTVRSLLFWAIAAAAMPQLFSADTALRAIRDCIDAAAGHDLCAMLRKEPEYVDI